MVDILDLVDSEEVDDAALESVSDALELSDNDGELDFNRAKELTEAIKVTATTTYILLAKAHSGKAYKALGYDTWAEYVREEFDMSPQRSYQLLDLNKVINELEDVLPENTELKITEAQAREIKRELPSITEKIKEETKDLDPDDAADRANEIIDEIREQKKLDNNEIENRKKQLEQDREDAYNKGLEDAADALLAREDAEKDEDDEPGSPVGLTAEDTMSLYNFFNALTSLTSMPEPEDFVDKLPEDRADEIDNQLSEAIDWLTDFKTHWDMR